MLRLALIIILLQANGYLVAQRYLTPVFDSVDLIEDVPYGLAPTYQGVSQSLLLDFYAPASDTVTSRPLLIYCHGGGFTDENQDKSLIHIAAYCDSLARRGYAVASIDYRLDSTICNRAVVNAMHDAKAAIRFFKANASSYGIDTALVFIAGESAGAVTALTASYVDQLSEVNYPPSLPLASVTSTEGESGNLGYSSSTKATLCFCGGTATSTGDQLFDTAAIALNDQALLMIHGTADNFIPILNSLAIAIRTTNIDVPNLFYPLEGATHCPWFFPLEDSWAYLDTLIDYSVPFLYACVQSTSGIDEIESQSSRFSLAPNPSSGLIHITDYRKIDQVTTIEVLDLTGQVQYSVRSHFNGGNTSVDLSALAPGLYVLRLLDDDGVTGSLSIIIE